MSANLDFFFLRRRKGGKKKEKKNWVKWKEEPKTSISWIFCGMEIKVKFKHISDCSFIRILKNNQDTYFSLKCKIYLQMDIIIKRIKQDKICIETNLIFYSGIFFFLLFFLFVVDFVICWNETAMGLHVFPIPIPPPTSPSPRSL